MDIYPTERIVLFIDGPNLHATAKALGFDIDYKKLLAHFSSRARLIRAIYYTTVLEQDEFVSIRPLVDWLEYNGYTLVTKPAKEFVDSLGRRRLKGSMDVELAVDAMRLSPSIDHAILFTGDGDFRSLVAALQRQGNRVSVASTLQAQSPMIADELRRQADIFIDLADLESVISRGPTARRAPSQPAGELDDDRDSDLGDAPMSDDASPAGSPSSASEADLDAGVRPASGGATVTRTPVVQHVRSRPRTPRPPLK
jgi:uncharacterized LabA/DUF88 family protein